MKYAVVTVELPDDDNLWTQFANSACRHSKNDQLFENQWQNRWLLKVEDQLLCLSALVVAADAKGISYSVHLFDSEPSIVSNNYE